MARDKKPKKNKYTDPKTGEFRHTDGDRRHRRGASAKDAIKNKKKMQEQSGLPPEETNTTDEWDEWGEPEEPEAGSENA